MSNDGALRTLLVAAGVALVCSIMVSTAVHYLRPIQAAYALLDRNRAILDAAGLIPPGGLSDAEVTQEYRELDARVLDLESDWFATGFDAYTYDHWAGSGEGETPGERPRYVPVYLLRDGDGLRRIVLPVDGPGMWSTIRGFIALRADLGTIDGVTFHSHGETPGIGDKIEDPAWRSRWQGKSLYDEGELKFRVSRRARRAYEVNAISGATKTARATGDLVVDWLGEDGFGPFLRNLETREL